MLSGARRQRFPLVFNEKPQGAATRRPRQQYQLIHRRASAIDPLRRLVDVRLSEREDLPSAFSLRGRPCARGADSNDTPPRTRGIAEVPLFVVVRSERERQVFAAGSLLSLFFSFFVA